MRILYPVEETISSKKARFIQLKKTWERMALECDVTIVAEGFEINIPNTKQKICNRKKIKTPFFRISWKIPFLICVAKEVLKTKPHVIYTRYRDSLLFLKLLFPNLVFGFLWEEPVYERENGLKRFITFIKEKLCLHLADTVVIVSPIQSPIAFKTFGISKPLLIAENGSDAEAKTIHRYYIPTLCYLGNLSEGKGLQYFERLQSELHKRFKVCQIKIIGSTTSQQFKSTGWLPQKDAWKEVKRSDIALLPLEEQRKFTSPMKLYDYILLNIPFVFIETSFSKLNLHCKVAEPCREANFTEKVIKLLLNAKRRKEIKANLKKLAPRLTWEKRASRILHAIQTQIKEKYGASR